MFPTITVLRKPDSKKDYIKYRCDLCGSEYILVYSTFLRRIVACKDCYDGNAEMKRRKARINEAYRYVHLKRKTT